VRNKLQSFSIIFLGVCILLGSWLISHSLKSISWDRRDFNKETRYEFISPNESNIIIFDKQSGTYWRKFIEPNSGPTDWEKQRSPITAPSN